MKPLTERLIQLAAGITLLWFGWTLAKETVVWNLQLSQRLSTCEANLSKARTEATK